MMFARKKKLLAIIIAGSIFVAWRGFSIVGRLLPAPARAVVVQIDPRPQPLIPPQRPEDFSALWQAEGLTEKQPWGRDPFDPQVFQPNSAVPQAPVQPAKAGPAPLPPTVVFSGVSKAGDRWLAAVNGVILSVGDVVQDKYKVVEISKSSITFAAESWAFTYPLGEKAPSVHPWTEKP